MVIFSLIVIACVLLFLWGVPMGFLYRSPVFLVLMGLALAIAGVLCIHVFNEMQSVPKVAKSFADLGLASQLISYTVAAAGGGLIASGIVFNAQRSAIVEKCSAEGDVRAELAQLQIVEGRRRELELNEEGLPEEELEAKKQDLFNLWFLVNERLKKAEKKLKRKTYID